MSDHMKTNTIIDTGTHRVDLIEDVDPACNWVGIYKLDDSGEVIGVMRIHGKDAEPYMMLAAKINPNKLPQEPYVSYLTRKYRAAIKNYTKYIQSNLNAKAEYYRGQLDSVLEMMKRVDPEHAGKLEEEKLQSYFD